MAAGTWRQRWPGRVRAGAEVVGSGPEEVLRGDRGLPVGPVGVAVMAGPRVSAG